MKSGREVIGGEMEGKRKIVGTAIATIILASVMVMIIPTVSGRQTTPGLAPNEIEPGDTVFIGEQGLLFDTDHDGVYGEVEDDVDFRLEGVPGTATEDEPPIEVDAHGWTVPDVTEGRYRPTVDLNGDGNVDEFDDIFIDKPEIEGDIILNTEEQDSIIGKSVPTTAEIVFKVETNIGGRIPGARVDIEVKRGDTKIREIDGQSLEDIEILGTTMFVGNPNPTTDAPPYDDALSLEDLDTGEYTVVMKLDKVSCNMLDLPTGEMKFTIRSEELSIEAEDRTVAVGEDIKLTIKGDPRTLYYLIITKVDPEAPPEIKNVGEVEVRGLDNLAAWIRTEANGEAHVEIATTNADDRTYTIKVYDMRGYDVNDNGIEDIREDPLPFFEDRDVDDAVAEADEESVDVKVEKARVTFDIPDSAIIGETVIIRGTITAGEEVDIVIPDANLVMNDRPVDENKEFEEEWDTSQLKPGTYIIYIYIDEPFESDDPDDYEDLEEDGKTSIRLMSPNLTAEQPRNAVAEGDDYSIKGTATGVDSVDIVLIGPKGYPTEVDVFNVENGLEFISASVTDNEFSEDIDMEDVDTGIWKALVFSPGRDGRYGDTDLEAGELEDIEDETGIDFSGKDQDQIVAMLLDRTVNMAGSDDLVVELTFKVESPYVKLNPIEAVPVGTPLNINGTTNREPGTIITISTFAGPTELPVAMVEVEWPTPDEGVFNATIDTSGAEPGTYTLEADDGDGHTDTVTVEIKAAVPSPSPSPSPTVSPTPTPTPTPTPSPSPAASPVAPTTPTPTPTPSPTPPGFEAIFAVAGLLAVTYFVLRRKK